MVFDIFVLILCHMIYMNIIYGFIIFFKQKTAYEMRISDWSSDVCSSDLLVEPLHAQREAAAPGDGGERRLQGRDGRAALQVLRRPDIEREARLAGRSEERREGTECVSTCRSWWSQSN